MHKRNFPAGSVMLSEHVVQFPLPTATLPPENFTNTYVIHQGAECLIIDVGCIETTCFTRLEQLLDALGCTKTVGLVATHYHHDHTAGLPHLSQLLHTPIYIQALDIEQARYSMLQNEGHYTHTKLNVHEAPPELRVGSLHVRLEHLPGHTHGHLHILVPEDDVVLVGDHLSGFGTVWIGPPDGHMELYYQALGHLVQAGYRIAGPGHGHALTNASEAASAIRQRRLNREQEMLDLLDNQSRTAAELTQTIYGRNIAPEVQWAAKKTVLAHLARMRDHNLVQRSYDTAKHAFVYSVNGPGTDS